MAQQVLSVLLTANNASLSRAFAAAAQDADKFGRKIDESSKRTTLAGQASKRAAGEMNNISGAAKQGAESTGRLSKSMSDLALAGKTFGTIGLAAMLWSSAKATLDFDRNMRNVNSLMNQANTTFVESEATFRKWSLEVLTLSTKLPQTAAQLSDGMYQITSSGFAGAGALEVLDNSATAASAGLTTTEISAKAIAAVLNAYSLEADSAQRVSDALFQTVNLGVIEFDTLATGIGQTLGIASRLDVEIETLGAAIATLTRVGATPDESMVWLKNMMNKLVSPSKELQRVYAELGYESGAAAVKSKGLQAVLQDLHGVVGNNVDSWLKLFPEIRASQGAMALMTDDGNLFAEMLEQGGTEAANFGVTQRVLTEQSKGLGFQLQMLKNKALKPFLEAMSGGAPAAGRGVESLTKALIAGGREAGEVWDRIDDPLRGVMRTLGDLGRELAPVAAALAKIGGGVIVAALVGTADALGAIAQAADVLSPAVEFLVTLLGVRWLAGLIASTKAAKLLSTEATLLSTRFGLLKLQTEVATGAQLGMNAASLAAVGRLGAQRLATQALGLAMSALPWAVLTLGITKYVNDTEKAKQHTKELREEMSSRFSKTDSLGLKAASAEIDEEMKRTEERIKKQDGLLNSLFNPRKGQRHGLLSDGSLLSADRRLKALGDAQKDVSRRTVNLNENLAETARQAGVTTDRVDQYAKSIGADLSGSYKDSESERKKVVTGLQKLIGTFGLTKESAKGMSAAQMEAMAEAAESASKTADKITDAWYGTASSVAAFGEEVETTFDDIRSFYQTRIAEQRAFGQNLITALREGLNPVYVRSLLIAGPKEAAPIINAILSGNRKDNIRLVNQSERELSRLTDVASELGQVMEGSIIGAVDNMNAETKTKLNDLVAAFSGSTATAATTAATNMASGTGAINATVAGWANVITNAASLVNQAFGGGPVRLPQFANFMGPVGPAQLQKKADGGVENHTAQIAAPTYRLWAEPETGGEAYIPLAMSKRTRSLEILAETARLMGHAVIPRGMTFANGGLVRPRYADGQLTTPANTHMDWAYRTYLEYERKMRSEYDRKVREYEAQMNPTQTYDVGGYLQPGITVAVNNTGQKEAVLTAKQWDRLLNSTNSRGRGATIIVNEAMSARETARQIDRRLR